MLLSHCLSDIGDQYWCLKTCLSVLTLNLLSCRNILSWRKKIKKDLDAEEEEEEEEKEQLEKGLVKSV